MERATDNYIVRNYFQISEWKCKVILTWQFEATNRMKYWKIQKEGEKKKKEMK